MNAPITASAAVRVPLLAYASLALGMTLVGTYVALSTLLVAAFPVFLLAWLRFGVAAAAMAHWVRPAPHDTPLTAASHRLLFWESFLGNFLFSICMLYGIRHSTALAAGVTMAALPAVVALMSWLFLKEPVGWRVWVGVVFTVLGIALVSLNKRDASEASSWWGNILLIGAVICEASYVVIGKRLTQGVSPKRISAIVNLWGLLLVTPLGLWQAYEFDFRGVAPSMWGLLIFYALAASVWSVWLWMTGLRHVPASRAGVFMVLLPITAAAVGVLVLGERFSAMQIVAFGLALTGLMLAVWPQRAQTP